MFIKKERFKKLGLLSLPLMISFASQNLMSITDTAMVGQFGDVSLAGVGYSAVFVMVFLAFFNGVDSAVIAVVSRRIGEGNHWKAGLTLNSAILYAVPSGILLMLIAYLILPWIVPMIIKDLEVEAIALGYLDMRLPMLSIVGISYVFAAYWNAIGKPKYFLYGMFVLLGTNVLFNYIFIFGKFGMPRMEAPGAGFGSTLSTLVTVLFNVVLGLVFARRNGFLQGLLEFKEIKTLIKTGMPVSVQQMFFQFGLSIMMMMMGLLSVKELAVASVLYVIVSVQALPLVGMGIAGSTLVGQALGRKEFIDAKKWGWEAARVGSAIMFAVSLIILCFPDKILSLFVIDQNTLQWAIWPLRVLAISVAYDTFTKVLNFCFRGAGAMKEAALIPFVSQWLIRIPGIAILIIILDQGLMSVIYFGLVANALELIITSYLWQRGRWAGALA